MADNFIDSNIGHHNPENGWVVFSPELAFLPFLTQRF